jgi:ribose transport system permease protein
MTTSFDSINGDPKADFAILDEKESFLRRVMKIQAMQVVLVLLLIIAAFSVVAPDTFLTFFNLRNVMINVSLFAILGVGMTFVIITAGIDLSIGSMLVFSSVVSIKVMQIIGGDGWYPSIIGILVALVIGTFWGTVNGLIIAYLKVPAFIVTLGTLSTILGISQITTGGIDWRGAPGNLVNKIGFGNIIGQVPVLGFIALIVVILGGILLHKTKFGLMTFAVGSNTEACRRVGINVNRHLVFVYALMGFLAGLAGILSIAEFEQTTIAGQSNTALTVIAGVVIGGTSLFGGYGSMFGTAVGLLIPIVLQTGFIIIGVVPFWQNIVVGVFLVAAVYVDTARRTAAERGGKRLIKRSSKKSTSTRKGK